MNFGLAPDEVSGGKGYTEPFHQREAVADAIVNKLQNPHIIALQEVAGDFEVSADGTVSASLNMQKLISSIRVAGGPQYRYAEVAPTNLADGGRPGANIRCGFLYRPDRVSLYETSSKAGPTTAASITTVDGKPHLSAGNPVRIDPENKAFRNSRKAIVGEFIDQKTGETYFISNLHLTARMRGHRAENAGLSEIAQQKANERRTQQRVDQVSTVTQFNEGLLNHIANNDSARSKIHVVALGDFNASLNESNDPSKSSAPEPVLHTMEKSGMHRACADFNRRHHYSAPTIHEEDTKDTVDHIFVSPELEKRIGKVKRTNLIDTNGTPAASDHNPTVININPEKFLSLSAAR